MDVRIGTTGDALRAAPSETLDSVVTAPRSRLRRRVAKTSADEESFGLARVLAWHSVARWEWILAVGALFVLGRSPVLFFRQRLAPVFGGKAAGIWQDDLVLVVTFAVVQIAVIAVAAHRAEIGALLRQPFLLAVLALAWLSISWSIEPAASARRALLFAGTAGVGWYVGDRFTPRELVSIAAKLAGVGTAASVFALFVWHRIASSTNGIPGWSSGVYVNRNLFGLVLSLGLLAAVFLIGRTKHTVLLWAGVPIITFLLVATKSRTGPVALLVAVGVAFAIYGLRRLAAGTLTAAGAATVVMLTLGTAGLYVHFSWPKILAHLGRNTDLTGRTFIWQFDQWLSRAHPWQGWGFEAVWTNPRIINQGRLAIGFFPFSSHNGYYEMLLSLGRVGILFFAAFLAVAAYRAFKYAWLRSDLISLWPLTLIVFGVMVNFSESLYVSSEATWALTVAAAVCATEWGRRDAEAGARAGQ